MSFGNYTESPSSPTSAQAELGRPSLPRGNGETEESLEEEKEEDFPQTETRINEISRTCSQKAVLKRKEKSLKSAPKTGGKKKGAGVPVRGGRVGKKSGAKKPKGT